MHALAASQQASKPRETVDRVLGASRAFWEANLSPSSSGLWSLGSPVYSRCACPFISAFLSIKTSSIDQNPAYKFAPCQASPSSGDLLRLFLKKILSPIYPFPSGRFYSGLIALSTFSECAQPLELFFFFFAARTG